MELDVVTYPLPSGELGVAAVEKARRNDSARAERLPRLARAYQPADALRCAAARRPRDAVAAAAGARQRAVGGGEPRRRRRHRKQ